jgi:hypothetical protein
MRNLFFFNILIINNLSNNLKKGKPQYAYRKDLLFYSELYNVLLYQKSDNNQISNCIQTKNTDLCH